MKKAMKVMAMVLFVVGMTALTSCTKSKEKMILGKWELEKVSVTMGGYSMQITVAELMELMGEYGEEIGDIDEMILEFKNDGYVYAQGEGVRYVIDGDQLTIDGGEEGTIEATITELTKTEMTLEGKETYEDEETGMSMTAVFNLYFKRL